MLLRYSPTPLSLVATPPSVSFSRSPSFQLSPHSPSIPQPIIRVLSSSALRRGEVACCAAMEDSTNSSATLESPHKLRLLFVEMGTGYDQHGQDITAAAVRACKNAISSNSIPAFRTGALPGVSYQQMKLRVKLGVPHSAQSGLDLEKVKAVFPYGEILDVEVVDGGLICSSGVALEAMGDKNDDCYVVNAAVYVGY